MEQNPATGDGQAGDRCTELLMEPSPSSQDPNKKLSTAAEELSSISKDERVSTHRNLPRHGVFHRKQSMVKHLTGLFPIMFAMSCFQFQFCENELLRHLLFYLHNCDRSSYIGRGQKWFKLHCPMPSWKLFKGTTEKANVE